MGGHDHLSFRTRQGRPSVSHEHEAFSLFCSEHCGEDPLRPALVDSGPIPQHPDQSCFILRALLRCAGPPPVLPPVLFPQHHGLSLHPYGSGPCKQWHHRRCDQLRVPSVHHDYHHVPRLGGTGIPVDLPVPPVVVDRGPRAQVERGAPPQAPRIIAVKDHASHGWDGGTWRQIGPARDGSVQATIHGCTTPISWRGPVPLFNERFCRAHSDEP
mmetsp:Transcript_5557/g.16397  ORF Transcript_5557/g.16397 Transcript_5557/m.16397 type:complete len:214 (+) Transcript_5557:644-1285(+)